MTEFDRAVRISVADFEAKFRPASVEPDIYFMDKDTDAPALLLDPYQEVDTSNWKQHCMMRDHFKKLNEIQQRGASEESALQITPANNASDIPNRVTKAVRRKRKRRRGS